MWKLGEVEEGPRWEERQAWLPGQRISALSRKRAYRGLMGT